MLKKLLILPILGLVGLTSLSYADTITIDGKSYTSDSEISVKQCSNENDCYSYGDDSPITDYEIPFYTCGILSEIVSGEGGYHFNGLLYEDEVAMSSLNTLYCFVNNQGSSSSYGIFPNDYDSDIYMNGYLLSSDNSITLVSSSSDSDSDGIITIPSNFVSGLNSLLTNFGNTIVNWLPTIILLGLGIVAVFSLFRVVRNYSRKSFKG